MGCTSRDSKMKHIPDLTSLMGVTGMKMNTCKIIVINV